MRTLLKNANQLVTITNNRDKPLMGSEMKNISVIEDGSVLIENDLISWVGQDKKLPKDYIEGSNVIDCSGKVIIPGLVDCHTHIVFGGSRENEFAMRIAGKTYLEIAQEGGGINNTVKATRSASLQELVNTGLKRLDESLHNGVTTVEIKSGYGLNLDTEIKMLQAINILKNKHKVTVIPTFLGGHDIPFDYKDRKDDYINYLVYEITPEVGKQKLARFCDVFCEKGVFDISDSENILNAGINHGMIPRLHADEFFPLGGAELAGKMNAVSADHLHAITDAGIQRMKEKGVIAVMLPGVSLFLNMKYPPGRRLIDNGLAVAIGTDFNPGSNMTQNLPLMMSISCFGMKLTPEEVLAATTFNAACALKVQDDVGSIEVGKKADVLILDIPNYNMMFYYYGKTHINKIIKNGEIL